jgi:hypothetical protein
VTAAFSNPARSWVFNSFDPWWLAYGRYLKSFFWAWDLDTFPQAVLFLRFKASYVKQYPLSCLLTVDKLTLDMEGIAEVP